MLPKLKHRQNLKHPSTAELSGVTRLLQVQNLQKSAGFKPKLGTGEGERNSLGRPLSSTTSGQLSIQKENKQGNKNIIPK